MEKGEIHEKAATANIFGYQCFAMYIQCQMTPQPASLRLLSVLFAFVLFSCDNEEDPAKPLPPFGSISANGPVTFNLVTGVTNQVMSTSLQSQQYFVSGGTLQINGTGSMTIAVKDINQFFCNGCTIENDGVLAADTLNMTVHGGHVDLNDLIITGWLGINSINLGNHEFTGTAHFFHVTTSNLSSIDAFQLMTDSVHVNSTSISDAEVTATQVVNVFINSSGNVKYKGNPPIVRLTKTGIGQLIKAD